MSTVLTLEAIEVHAEGEPGRVITSAAELDDVDLAEDLGEQTAQEVVVVEIAERLVRRRTEGRDDCVHRSDRVEQRTDRASIRGVHGR